MGTSSYDAAIKHDGQLHKFTIPKLHLPICQACGEKIFTEKVDDQITEAFRAHLHLLTPAEIGAGLARLNLSVAEAAERLGIAEDDLAAWLDDRRVQPRALDNLLRVFFGVAEVREMLRGHVDNGKSAEAKAVPAV